MINLKVKDGKEDKAKFVIGGSPAMLQNQSLLMVMAISKVIENDIADENAAKEFLIRCISELKEYYINEYGS